MALVRFASLGNTGATQSTARIKKPWRQTAVTVRKRALKIHIGGNWAIYITGLCQNCDNPETMVAPKPMEPAWNMFVPLCHQIHHGKTTFAVTKSS